VREKLRLTLCRNVSVTFLVTTEISCRSVVPFSMDEAQLIHKHFLSSPLLPTMLKVPLKSHSVCAKTHPDIIKPWCRVLVKTSLMIHLSRASHLQYLERQFCTCLRDAHKHHTSVSFVGACRSQNMMSGVLFSSLIKDNLCQPEYLEITREQGYLVLSVLVAELQSH